MSRPEPPRGVFTKPPGGMEGRSARVTLTTTRRQRPRGTVADLTEVEPPPYGCCVPTATRIARRIQGTTVRAIILREASP
jgi:hypothetical protein